MLSRQGQVFWIRVISGAAGIVTLGLLLAQEVQVGPFLGYQLLAGLNTAMLFTILLVGPVITADCIAQEKREGTLGLLFLAPLSARDIVLSKLAANALRAGTLLLAMLPMMILPVVLGGIPVYMSVLMVTELVTALCLALSAGVLASTLHREFVQAAVWSVIYALGLAVLFFILVRIVGVLAYCTPLAGTPLIFLVPVYVLASGLIVVERTVKFSSLALRERWEAEGADYQAPGWVRMFSDSDFWRALFTWDTRRARSAHPIAWLQEYSWTARLAKWGWCAIALVGEIVVLVMAIGAGRDRGYHVALATMVVLGMALAGANSFRKERLSGAMELLLVTPLKPWQLIAGRLWGVWVHFLPAVAIIAFLWLGTGSLVKGNPEQAWVLVSSWVFMPMVGLYISMLPWNVLVAWVVIFICGALLPVWLVRLGGFSSGWEVWGTILVQAAVGIGSVLVLQEKLKSRNFQFPNA